MRALVTGGTGFVGSYLVRKLVERGEDVAVLIRPGANTWRIDDVISRVTRIEGDLTALKEIEEAIRIFSPDTIFHLAWHGVANRFRNEIDQIDRNLNASLSLFRLALKIGCRTWIGTGSQAEYGPCNRVCDENAPTRPTSLYGTVKLCTYLLLQQLAVDAGIRFAWFRIFSTYGPRDNPEWMIPSVIRSLLRAERPSLTAGEQQWDYLYVEDAAQALYLSALVNTTQGVYNLGSGKAHSIRSIVEGIRDMVDPSLALGFGEVPYRFDQVMHLQADVSRLTRDTGWLPSTSLDAGLRQTLDWHEQDFNR
jgi:nucleoside-diphosphate-sugar epimerase